MYECSHCRLMWVGDVIQKEQLDSFYEKQYFEGQGEYGYYGVSYETLERLHRKNARRLLRLCNSVAPLQGKRLLDVGCGYGYLLHEAQRLYGCTGVGLEISECASAFARERLHLDVRRRELEDAGLEDATVDLALMVGSLEHLIRPDLVLEETARLLKPDGLLLVSTLDTSGPIPLYQIKPPEHLFYFNRANCSFLLERCGFRVMSARLLFWWYDFIDVLVRLVEFLGLHPLPRWCRAVGERLPLIPILIPTNEVIILAKKP